MSKFYLSNNKFDNNDNNWNNDKNDNHTNKDDDKNFVSIFFFNKKEDLCFVQKIFYNLFYEYQKPVIPEIVDNWEELDAEGKKCMTGVNVFYSSLHFL